jgi:hypothetical protein
MSDPNEQRDLPPGIRLLLSIISGGPVTVHSAEEVQASHAKWHEDTIRTWESNRKGLEEQFGKAMAADLIEMQRMSHRACDNKHFAMSRVMGAASELMAMAEGHPQVLFPVVEMMESLIAQISEYAERREREAAKSKPKRKPSAKARAAAEAEAAKRRAEAESN